MYFYCVNNKSITTMKYSKQCRLCLKKSGIYDVFETPELAQEIFLSIGMQITRSNNLPQRICMKCFKIITNIGNLRKVAVESELLLRKEYNYGEDLLKDAVKQMDETVDESNNKDEDNVSSTKHTIKDPITITSDDVEHNQKSVSVKRERSSSPEIAPVKKIAVRADLFRTSLPDKKPELENRAYIEGAKFGITKRYTMSPSGPVDVSYTCAECPKSFAKWKQVYLHQRTHNKTKTCPIDLCNKKFASKGDLEKHLRIHTGERPYKCSICDRGFTQTGTLKLHYESVHGTSHLSSKYWPG